MSPRAPLPAFASWRHLGEREGHEVVFLDRRADRLVAEGLTAAVEAGQPFAVRYTVEVDEGWRTLSARVWSRSHAGDLAVTLEGDGRGGWRVDGRETPELEGCLDVDLESSALTNALPVRRLELAPGDEAEAPAAYVRALDLRVERLEQRYRRMAGGAGPERYDYAAPAFGVRCRLTCDAAGLTVDYPNLAARVV